MEQVKGAGEAALLQTAADIVDIAKQLVPVETSSLQKSIGAEVVDSTTVNVGAGAAGVFIDGREPSKYAAAVEFGRVHSAAQPFLIPAFAQAETLFKTRLEEKLKEVK
jgi:HK97 gp10 family phage protein